MAGMKHQIRLIPAALAVMAIVGAGCTSGAPAGADAGEPSQAAADAPVTASSLNGTYRYEITLAEAEEADMVDPQDEYPNVVTVTLSDGELEGGCFGAAGGTYKVEGDQIEFHSIEYDAGATVTFTQETDGSLTLTPVPPIDRGDAFVCFSQVWTKIA